MNGTWINTFDFIKIGNRINDTGQALSIRGKNTVGLINAQNILHTDKRIRSDALTAWTVYSVHVTKDIIIHNVSDYLLSLAHIPFKGLIVRSYKNSSTGVLQSIVIMSRARQGRSGRRLYLTLYDKFAESGNPEFRDVLRIEQKINSFEELRTLFNVGCNDLFSILHSNIDPIDTTLQKVKNQIDNNDLTQLCTNDFNLRVYEAYFEKFNFDFYAIEQDMKLCGATLYYRKKAHAIFIVVMEMSGYSGQTDPFFSL